MSAPDPAAIPVSETVSFIRAALPSPPARVLDVGCGSGVLLRHLLAAGYEATGIDSDSESVAEAAEEGLPVDEADFLGFEGRGYDAVFFGRSLHHVFPLESAVQRAHEVLVGRGVVVAEEFAVDAMDSITAMWFYDLLSVLETAGLLKPEPHGRPEVAEPMKRWQTEHDFDPPLHTGGEMIEGLGRRFELEPVAGVPYLYRDFCALIEKSARGHAVAQLVLQRETAGLEAGSLAATGLRLVGRRR